MTERKHLVERQRLLLEAEKWANGVQHIHVHRLKSLCYDTRPEDTDNGSVCDTTYNNGTIVREQNGKIIHIFGRLLRGDDLIEAYQRANADNFWRSNENN